jgi:hypothetical protein
VAQASQPSTSTANPKRVLTDHFLKNQPLIKMLHKYLVDTNTRCPKFATTSVHKLHKLLCADTRTSEMMQITTLARSTLQGWFKFTGSVAGQKAADTFPTATVCFLDGMEAGYNLGLHMSTGRPVKIPGAEDTLSRIIVYLQTVRNAGVSLNTYTVRALLVNALIEDGHQPYLSPHLYDENADKDKKLHTMSYCWIRSFLVQRLEWSWRAGTKAAQKLPEDHADLINDALLRIAYLSAKYNIPRCRVFMADETFLHYTPESKCVPFRNPTVLHLFVLLKV